MSIRKNASTITGRKLLHLRIFWISELWKRLKFKLKILKFTKNMLKCYNSSFSAFHRRLHKNFPEESESPVPIQNLAVHVFKQVHSKNSIQMQLMNSIYMGWFNKFMQGTSQWSWYGKIGAKTLGGVRIKPKIIIMLLPWIRIQSSREFLKPCL